METKETKELKPIRWQGPDGAIHTISVQKQKDQAAAEAEHNATIRAMMPGGAPNRSLRKSGIKTDEA